MVDSLKKTLTDGFIESESGWMISISRPRSTNCDLAITANDFSEWSFLFTEKNDRIEKRHDGFLLSLVPSKVGAVSLFVPNIRGIQIATGSEQVTIDDQEVLSIDGVHIKATPCRGVPPESFDDGMIHPRSDEHKEQLKALGYLQ